MDPAWSTEIVEDFRVIATVAQNEAAGFAIHKIATRHANKHLLISLLFNVMVKCTEMAKTGKKLKQGKQLMDGRKFT